MTHSLCPFHYCIFTYLFCEGRYVNTLVLMTPTVLLSSQESAQKLEQNVYLFGSAVESVLYRYGKVNLFYNNELLQSFLFTIQTVPFILYGWQEIVLTSRGHCSISYFIGITFSVEVSGLFHFSLFTSAKGVHKLY